MNARVVLDIYGYCMGHTNNEFFFSRDVEKAFDSVQWFFWFPVLKKINFRDNFITWVKCLYTNLIFLELKIIIGFQKLTDE